MNDKERIDSVFAAAQAAFWAVVRASYPEARSDNPDAEYQFNVRIKLYRCVESWVLRNVVSRERNYSSAQEARFRQEAYESRWRTASPFGDFDPFAGWPGSRGRAHKEESEAAQNVLVEVLAMQYAEVLCRYADAGPKKVSSCSNNEAEFKTIYREACRKTHPDTTKRKTEKEFDEMQKAADALRALRGWK